MNKVIRVIGTLILASLIVSVPVIFGVSIGANWYIGVSILLGIILVGEICIMSVWMYFETEE